MLWGGGEGGLRSTFRVSRSRIHERRISLRFLGIILRLRVLRLEVSAYNVYITNPFQPTFAQRGEGIKSFSRGEEDNSEDFCPNYVQEFGLRCILCNVHMLYVRVYTVDLHLGGIRVSLRRRIHTFTSMLHLWTRKPFNEKTISTCIKIFVLLWGPGMTSLLKCH